LAQMEKSYRQLKMKKMANKKKPARVKEMRYFDYQIDAMKREEDLFPVISFWLGFWQPTIRGRYE